MIKRHTTGNRFDNSLSFGKKILSVYIARFEASLKYVILKQRLIKALLNKQLKFANA